VIRVRNARFVAAVREAGRYPDRIDPAIGREPEIAFAGRSNVGKSSLINTLLGRRALARTSKTPGRTRQLNFYVVETVSGTFVFVDLPGYGYARVSKGEHAAWRSLVESYLEGRTLLRGVILVVDIRRGIELEERELLDYLNFHRRPVIVAATKIDKLSRGSRSAALGAIGAAAGDTPVVAVSSETREGRDEIWRRLTV
jgi:GTP-binding protein